MRGLFSSFRLREGLLAAGILFCVGYAWLSTAEIAPNERARIYLTVALVDRGDVKVDEEVDTYGQNWDLSRRNGHWYCNKPPGASILAAPVYQLARWIGGDGEWSMPGLFHLTRFGVMLPLALLGFVAIRRWMELLDLSEVVVDVTSVGWLMGSAAFHYAGAFFSHHVVAVFLVVGIWLLEEIRQSGREESGSGEGATGFYDARDLIRAGAAGLALGLVGLTEYQAGVSSLFVALWVLSQRELRRLPVLLPFATAAAVCVGGLFWYDTVAFGGPLEFSYKYHISGGGGEPLSYPQLDYFAGLLFDLEWGLFPNAPWFFLAVPGFVYLASTRNRADLAVLFGAILAFRILLISGYDWWMGGWAFGPRHLVANMGLLTVLSAIAFERLRTGLVARGVGRGLILTGIVYNQVQVAFLGELPRGPDNPIMDVVVPFVGEGIHSPNLVSAIWGIRGLETLIPLGVVAAALALFVLVRGLSATTGWGRRAFEVGTALLPVVAFGLHVQARGSNWDEKWRDSFRDMMERRLESDIDWHRRDNRDSSGN